MRLADAIGAVPVIPARAVADVLATGTVAHARVCVLRQAGVVLAVWRDKLHPEAGQLLLRGWSYSMKYHCAFFALRIRRVNGSA